MAATTEVEEFLATMLPRQRDAEQALCRGDARARTATWSRHDPVTLFGAAVTLRQGWDAVDATSRAIAERVADKHLRDYELQVVAAGADADLAYTVAFEHKTFVVDGEPVSYTLRVTHVYRREDGEWRIVHRHGDFPPPGQDARSPVTSREWPASLR
ncbi:nuclear transport factor 2 family protein [Actinomycetospora cinnamomea]|uniref:Ketosteroid isomerase-like protein n=1 Tax=Actinomycetospora cinnamomea TaxID=663609 RepID=A0A2U1FRZ5_9PSEU|nr:nuclear transport factor 2 family protein [Actinomycetospora cinnamomea]PVZ14943.1 ketosteroid isomerase-like protein [Actinomycetospora cinnamomea]